MAFEPVNRSQVIKALREHGPMTRYELAEQLRWTVAKVGATIGSTRWLLPKKVFRIVRFKDEVYQGHMRQVAVFAAQAGEDAIPPVHDQHARRLKTNARYRDKNRAAINARDRQKRARDKGLPIVQNPWLQLAPPCMRPAMNQRSLIS